MNWDGQTFKLLYLEPSSSLRTITPTNSTYSLTETTGFAPSLQNGQLYLFSNAMK